MLNSGQFWCTSPTPVILYTFNLLRSPNLAVKVQWTMIGMDDMMWGRSVALRGQLGILYLFQDNLLPSQVSEMPAYFGTCSMKIDRELRDGFTSGTS